MDHVYLKFVKKLMTSSLFCFYDLSIVNKFPLCHQQVILAYPFSDKDELSDPTGKSSIKISDINTKWNEESYFKSYTSF